MEKTVRMLIDDIDGSEATERIEFTLGGTSYRLDLNEKHAKEFNDDLDPWLAKAQKLSRFTRSSASSTAEKSDKEELARIREWAKANGYKVSDRGRIAQTTKDAYYASIASK